MVVFLFIIDNALNRIDFFLSKCHKIYQKNKEKLLFVFEWIEMHVSDIYNYVVTMLVITKSLIKVLINYRIGDFIYLCFS